MFHNLWPRYLQALRTFKFKLDVSESLDLLQAAGVKKLWLRAGYSYAGLSERRLVEITSDNKKYLKFDAKFNK